MEQLNEITQPENVKRHTRRWRRVRIYLRELSVIIVGILITVMITGLVSSFSRQKELRGMLSRVTEELRQNIKSVNEAKNYYQMEQHGFSLLQANMDDIRKIPADTLDDYRFIVGSIHSLDLKNDAYEVLKNSVLTQYIRQKGLMTDLSAAYGRLELLSKQLTQYSEQKSEFLFPMLQSLDPEQVELWMNGSVYDWFLFPARDRGVRTF